MLGKDTGLWAILGSAEDFQGTSIRYGLALLATTLQAQKGHAFPILILLTEGSLQPETLPTALKDAQVMSLSDAGFGAKVVAKVHSPLKTTQSDSTSMGMHK